MKIKFEAILEKFDKKGEKSGWTYIYIFSELAKKLNKANKKSFYIKGKIDKVPVKHLCLIPMGEGDYILPVNNELRKKLGKSKGMSVQIEFEKDDSEYAMDIDFLSCLSEESVAKQFFETLTPSHQKYFSKWIESAKTIDTKSKRIARSINALKRKMGYPEMLREK